MWPFKRRRPGDATDLSDLRNFVESNPVKKYVNCLLLALVKQGEGEHRFSQPEPLPAPPRLSREDYEQASFAHVVNRLKVMSQLDPVTYHEAKEGKIELHVGSVGTVIIHARFDDAEHAFLLRVELVGRG